MESGNPSRGLRRPLLCPYRGVTDAGPLRPESLARRTELRAAAVNVGTWICQGIDFLRKEYAQGLPLISAICWTLPKKLYFPPFAIKEVSVSGSS
jgi:hypothetical protein